MAIHEKKLAVGDVLNLVQEYTIEKYLGKNPTFTKMEQYSQKKYIIYTEKIHEVVANLSEQIFNLVELNS